MCKKNIFEFSEEQELTLLLCEFKHPNNERIRDFLSKKLDWSQVLGYLSYNRVAGLAYHVIFNDLKITNINDGFRFGLYAIYEFQKLRAKSLIRNIFELSEKLNKTKIRYAFLKGSILALEMYPIGCRASNDIDLLIKSDDVTRCGEILNELNYIQGKFNSKEMVIIPASRREIINSKINFGEVVPYQKIIYEPGLNYVEVDINFSLDWKAVGTEDTVSEFLDFGLSNYIQNGKTISTLSPSYFLAQLCVHLYKEAVGLNWVEWQRDLSLYKFVDIYGFFHKSIEEFDWSEFSEIVKKNNIEKECYYALEYTRLLFPSIENESVLKIINLIKPEDTTYLNYVVNPAKEDEKYLWKETFKSRIFNLKRYNSIEKI